MDSIRGALRELQDVAAEVAAPHDSPAIDQGYAHGQESVMGASLKGHDTCLCPRLCISGGSGLLSDSRARTLGIQQKRKAIDVSLFQVSRVADTDTTVVVRTLL